MTSPVAFHNDDEPADMAGNDTLIGPVDKFFRLEGHGYFINNLFMRYTNWQAGSALS